MSRASHVEELDAILIRIKISSLTWTVSHETVRFHNAAVNNFADAKSYFYFVYQLPLT